MSLDKEIHCDVKRTLLGKIQIRFQCTGCGNSMAADEGDIGQTARCTRCGLPLVVPGRLKLLELKDNESQKETEQGERKAKREQEKRLIKQKKAGSNARKSDSSKTAGQESDSGCKGAILLLIIPLGLSITAAFFIDTELKELDPQFKAPSFWIRLGAVFIGTIAGVIGWTIGDICRRIVMRIVGPHFVIVSGENYGEVLVKLIGIKLFCCYGPQIIGVLVGPLIAAFIVAG